MSADTYSAKAKLASNGPREGPALPGQSDTQNSSGQKDMSTIVQEAVERLKKMTREKMLERHPWMKNNPPHPVTAATAMPVMEEMEREEAAAFGEDEMTGADKAS